MSAELLTAEELDAMQTLGKVAGQLHRIIGDGPQSRGDWAEAADKIHQLQAMVMAQAASRAYPELFRPLGGYIEPEPGPPSYVAGAPGDLPAA